MITFNSGRFFQQITEVAPKSPCKKGKLVRSGDGSCLLYLEPIDTQIESYKPLSLRVCAQITKVSPSTPPTRLQIGPSIEVQHPKKISELFQGFKTGIYTKHNGFNRSIFINNNTKYGYKVARSTYEYDSNLDLRLNEVYSGNIYNGKYKDLVKNFTLDIVDDRCNKNIKISAFKVIDNSVQLNDSVDIPPIVQKEMYEAGYYISDFRGCNFVSVDNENGEKEFILIDAKHLGKKNSDSLRTKTAIKLFKKYFK